MDELNARILRLLQQNGRVSYHDLAVAVGRSDSTIRDRVQRLERDGLVRGYTALLDWPRLGLPTKGLVSCAPTIAPAEFVRELARFPGVEACWVTRGERPVTFTVHARDAADLELFLQRFVKPLGVSDLRCELIEAETLPAFERHEPAPAAATPAPGPLVVDGERDAAAAF